MHLEGKLVTYVLAWRSLNEEEPHSDLMQRLPCIPQRPWTWYWDSMGIWWPPLRTGECILPVEGRVRQIFGYQRGRFSSQSAAYRLSWVLAFWACPRWYFPSSQSGVNCFGLWTVSGSYMSFPARSLSTCVATQWWLLCQPGCGVRGHGAESPCGVDEK